MTELEYIERKDAIEELRRDHNWCGVHDCQLVNGQSYYYQQLQGQQNLFGQSLGGFSTTNTIMSMPYISGPYCPKCMEERELRKTELRRKLGHTW